MTDILADLSPSSLAHAIKANLYAFFQSFRSSSNAEVEDGAQSFRWHTSVAHPWFNGVLSMVPPGQDVDDLVRATQAYFRSRGVADFTWWLAPALDTSAWAQHLLAHGFQYDDHTPGMALDLAALPAPVESPLAIRPVEDSATLGEWARTFLQGYELPEAVAPNFLALTESLGIELPIRHYLGVLGGRPVAASTLFLGAGVAGIYNVATLPEARGQGIGSAMTLAPLYQARDLGYRAGILQSSDIGYRVYQRLGFQKLCQIEHFYGQSQV
jgi:GNAT superfamily N-acetyltransferase